MVLATPVSPAVSQTVRRAVQGAGRGRRAWTSRRGRRSRMTGENGGRGRRGVDGERGRRGARWAKFVPTGPREAVPAVVGLGEAVPPPVLPGAVPAQLGRRVERDVSSVSVEKPPRVPPVARGHSARNPPPGAGQTDGPLGRAARLQPGRLGGRQSETDRQTTDSRRERETDHRGERSSTESE